MKNAEAYILFDLAGTTYGLRSRDVLHMEMLERITPVPNAPPFVEGVVFSRGQVIPVVNLRVRFGFPPQPHTLRTRLIVVQAGKRSVGLIVDSAREFRGIEQEAIQPPDAGLGTLSGNYVSGIVSLDDRLVLLLDVEAALALVASQVEPAAAT